MDSANEDDGFDSDTICMAFEAPLLRLVALDKAAAAANDASLESYSGVEEAAEGDDSADAIKAVLVQAAAGGKSWRAAASAPSLIRNLTTKRGCAWIASVISVRNASAHA